MKTNITKECEGCGEEINPRRLQAMPNTKTCIGCQEDNEKAGRFALHRMDVKGTTRCGEIDEVQMVLHRGMG